MTNHNASQNVTAAQRTRSSLKRRQHNQCNPCRISTHHILQHWKRNVRRAYATKKRWHFFSHTLTAWLQCFFACGTFTATLCRSQNTSSAVSALFCFLTGECLCKHEPCVGSSGFMISYVGMSCGGQYVSCGACWCVVVCACLCLVFSFVDAFDGHY